MLSFSRGVLPLAAICLLSSLSSGQIAGPQTLHLGYDHDTGLVRNDSPTRTVVVSFPIYVQGAASLRVHFEDVLLAGEVQRGNHSILRVTSWKDGATHEMDPIEVTQWQNTSCYLNGDTVQVEVLAYPDSGPNRLVVDSIEAGMVPIQYSQCGPTDDRVPSNDPRNARALPIGCTAWMFDDCNHCFGTAGHCIGGSSTIQFNVPLSNPDGSLNHPGPEDQYATDFSSDQSQNSGIGFDWAYFGVFPNSNTGLTPAQAQGSWYTLAPTMPPFAASDKIRITGYGVDSGTSNQIQQTHSGRWVGLTGTDVEYQVDTQGGNSGSPVQHETLDMVIGVHTHAGCSTSSGNHGTGINHTGWQSALANPQGVCAQPCNQVSTYCTGKLNSEGCVPQIDGQGTPSINSAAGDFVLSATDVIAGNTGLLFWGLAPDNQPFLGGTLCVAGPLQRMSSQAAMGAGGSCSGTLTEDFGVAMSSGTFPNLQVGVDVYAQFYARDPQAAVAPVTFTDAATFQIQP